MCKELKKVPISLPVPIHAFVGEVPNLIATFFYIVSSWTGVGRKSVRVIFYGPLPLRR